jgi:hypothetical protein
MKPIIVIGSKPKAILPDVATEVVYTANAAATRGLFYRAKFGTRIIAVVGSGTLQKDEKVRAHLSIAEPDTIIILGDKLRHSASKIVSSVGLTGTEIKCLNSREQFNLIRERAGVLALFAALHCYPLNPFWPLRVARALYKAAAGDYGWAHASTGLSALLLAARDRGESNIIATGITLFSGTHVQDNKLFSDRRAKVDRGVMTLWPVKKRAFLMTTENQMADFAGVTLYNGGFVHADD